MYSNIKMMLDKLSTDELKEVLDYVYNRVSNVNIPEISTISIDYVELGLDLDSVKRYISEKSIRYLFHEHVEIDIQQIDNTPIVLIDDNGCMELVLQLNGSYITLNIDEYLKFIPKSEFNFLTPYEEYIIYSDDNNREESDNSGYFYTINCPYCGGGLHIKRDIWDGSGHVTEYSYDDFCDECGLLYSIAESEIAIDIPKFIFKLIRDGYYKVENESIVFPISYYDRISLENFRIK